MTNIDIKADVLSAYNLIKKYIYGKMLKSFCYNNLTSNLALLIYIFHRHANTHHLNISKG